MLKWSVIFLIIAVVAAAFGFTEIDAGATTIAKVLFYLFAMFFLIFLIFGLTVAKKIAS